MNNRIDHIAIGADSLDAGVVALRQTLGVELPRGGKHPDMSTHNCVAQAGDNAFLELIAIDPEAPPPGRARWFTLDDATTRARIAERPRALCWVVNTDDLDGVLDRSQVDLGEVLNLSRGDLRWRLTVPRDGSLPLGGLLPAFIEWSAEPHPSTRMQDVGLCLDAVQLAHPDPDALGSHLESLEIAGLAEVSAAPVPALSFRMTTPTGRHVVIE